MSSFQTRFEGSDVGVIYEFLSTRERAHHVVSLLEATSTRLRYSFFFIVTGRGEKTLHLNFPLYRQKSCITYTV
jgi:hypothetical protein